MTEQTPAPVNPYAAAPSPLSPSDERLWATLIHVGGIFFGFLVPLIGYLVLKDRGPLVRQHSATALNFQLTVLIGYVASWILMFVLIYQCVTLLGAWETAISGVVISPPAQGPDGRIYSCADDRALHCLDQSTGKEYWAFRPGRRLSGPCGS